MEINYDKINLEIFFSLQQLKNIAKTRGLNTKGNKQELINRILENQDLTGTYLGLLPKEIREEVKKMRISDSPTNQFITKLDGQVFEMKNIEHLHQLQDFMQKYHLEIAIYQQYNTNRFRVSINDELPLIDHFQFEELLKILSHLTDESKQRILQYLREVGINPPIEFTKQSTLSGSGPLGPDCIIS